MRAGTVTRLVAQKKNPNRVSIFIDGAFAFGLYVDVLHKQGLRKGVHLSIPEQEALLQADQAVVAYNIALRYIAYRPRSVREVERKLRGKDMADDVIELTIERLKVAGYLDDGTYAQAYVQERLSTRGYGPHRIRRELRRRGIARRIIEKTLETLTDEENTLALARQHAERRWPRLEREPDARKRKKKLYDFLVRRGFDFAVARQVAEEFEGRTP